MPSSSPLRANVPAARAVSGGDARERRAGIDLQRDLQAQHARVGPAAGMAARARGRLGVRERRLRLLEPPRGEQRGAELDERVDVLDRAGRLHRRRLPEQRDGGRHGAACDRGLGGGDEVRGGAAAELGARRGVVAELAGVAPGLAEVVAEHRVGAGIALLEPVGEAQVQPRPALLGHRLVGGAVQQHVAEAEGVVARELGARRADEALAHEGEHGRAVVALAAVARERRERLAVEDGALDRRAREHVALVVGEPVDALLQQRAQRRGQRRARSRTTARSRTRPPARRRAGCPPTAGRSGARRPAAAMRPRAGRDELLGVLGRERIEHREHAGALRAGPGRALLEQLRTRERDQHDGAVRERCEVLDEVEQPGLGPVQVVERDHQRPVGCDALEQPAERPLDLLAGAAAPAGADRDRDAIGDLLAALDIGEAGGQTLGDVVPTRSRTTASSANTLVLSP